MPGQIMIWTGTSIWKSIPGDSIKYHVYMYHRNIKYCNTIGSGKYGNYQPENNLSSEQKLRNILIKKKGMNKEKSYLYVLGMSCYNEADRPTNMQKNHVFHR